MPTGCKEFFLGVATERYLARIRNGISVWVWTAKEESLFEDHLGPGPASLIGPWIFFTIHLKSQTDLVGKDNGYLCRSDLCRAGVAQREGTRPEQMWTDQNHPLEFLTKFLSATEALNLLRARTVTFGICQTIWPGKFHSRSRTFAISDASLSLRDIVVNRDRYVVLKY